jgi:stage II sporulation protein D
MRIFKDMVRVFNAKSGIHNPHSTFRIPHFAILKILVLILSLLPSACSRKTKVMPPPATRPPASAAPSTAPPTAPAKPAQPMTRPEPSIAPPLAPQAVPATSGHLNVIPGPGPLIRIGLTTAASEVRVLSAGEYLMTEKMPEALTESVQNEIRIRIERDSGLETESYRIQVASLSTLEAAQELRRRLSALFSLPVVIRESVPGSLRQVRLGEFGTREEAQKFAAKQLAEAGFRNTFIVRETGPAGTSSGELTLVLRGSESLFRVNKSGFLFFPKPEGNHLQLDGKPYRGSLDISLNQNGRITVVNQLGIEEYLLGVVPAELSPTHYPDPEALAAQSVAARTYALKNMGRYRTEGYDLTADIRTQVYGGVAQEKEGATQAVGATYGLAIYYQNNLIDAMYTSTCGGRTEDFSNVYEGPPVPYLRSVLCSAEANASADGAASDRISPGAGWKVTISRLEIARKIRPLAANIGTLHDLKPSRLGNSGRVVRLELIGSRGRVIVNGYKFRNALGLRDTLFAIARTKNPNGSIESFTFNGRGWGHGVGLCQVGAVGMARAGRKFEEILKTYYQGVELRKAY